MKVRFRKGQSIMEITLLLAVIIGVLVAVLLKQGGLKDKITGAYDATGTALENTTADLTGGIFQ
ncbi:MAG: hypothetical protein ISS45_02270 [Candidatus Omnitrophica bacterium]|nr:hypothetical protein [Candidatus Omnitrophota bacterium]